MDYEDRVSIATPEGVEMELVLAGLGSRMVATIVDTLIIGTTLLALWVVGLFGAAGGEDIAGVMVALMSVASFLVLFGYGIAFETLTSGRTPGKRVAGLRVVRAGGEPPGFLACAVRNLMRLVDILPGFYAVGAVAIFVSPRNQRLGDLAAGTLVVRERRGARLGRPAARADDWAAADRYAAWDVSGITAFELVTVRRFLERRHNLDGYSRSRLARDLANRLRPRVAGAPEGQPPEEFLEALAALKAGRA